MLKILSAQQIRALDAHTIAQEPIASIDLMERASVAFVSWLMPRVKDNDRILVVCGTGNNGGDGLAIARLLSDYNFNVSACIIDAGTKTTPDFQANLKRLPSNVLLQRIDKTNDAINIKKCTILIDAILGTGISRPIEGIYANCIQQINDANIIRIAVDVPSGLVTDGIVNGPVVNAHYTISFQIPKLCFLLPQNFEAVGEWHLVNIGLDKNLIKEASSNYFLFQKNDAKQLLKQKRKADHKGSNGHALLIAGSKGKMGAALLASKACMRAGAGLLTTHLPTCGVSSLQSFLPESMISYDEDENIFSTLPTLDGIDAIGVGPGLGQAATTVKVFQKLLEGNLPRLVLDADALNLLAANPNLQMILPKHTILTPHPGEFKRLVGEWKDDLERLKKLINFSNRINCVVILKGAHTTIALPNGEVYFNTSGNPGMATAGSGDVLTGIITSLLAQGYAPEEASLLGVFLHGFAGDLAAQDIGEQALIASDIIKFLPDAYLSLS